MSKEKDLKKVVKKLDKLAETFEAMLVRMETLAETMSNLGLAPAAAGASSDTDSDAGKSSDTDSDAGKSSDTDSDVDVSKMKKKELEELIEEKDLKVKVKKFKKLADLRKAVIKALKDADTDSDAGAGTDSDAGKSSDTDSDAGAGTDSDAGKGTDTDTDSD